jgi:hypothetical protein
MQTNREGGKQNHYPKKRREIAKELRGKTTLLKINYMK